MTSAGLSAEARIGDLSDIEATAAVIEALRPLDIFVNSAGLAVTRRPPIRIRMTLTR